MRRLTLYALAGAIAISACSDQNTESPTGPSIAPPSNTFVCSHGPYPFTTVAPLTQDSDIFKAKPTKAEALLRLGTVALLWNTCNDLQARKAALLMLTWIDQNKSKNASQAKVDALKAAILNGFGAGAEGGDFVTKFFVPGAPDVVQYFTTSDHDATLALNGDAFTEPTLITIRRLPDDFTLTVPEGLAQSKPYYDYDATNSSTDNTVATHSPKPGSVIMAFCFEPVAVVYDNFPGAKIGHNPVDGTFEFVPEVPLTEGITAELSKCPPPPILGLGRRGGGFRGMTTYLSSLAGELLLPTPLSATTVGTRGPIAGTPISLSPFGIVLPDCEQFSDEDFCQPILQ
jgi:hypothetical protein